MGFKIYKIFKNSKGNCCDIYKYILKYLKVKTQMKPSEIVIVLDN